MSGDSGEGGDSGETSNIGDSGINCTVLAEVTVGPTEPQICFEWATVLQKKLAYKFCSAKNFGPTKL
jgi:hypothetical protein